MLLKIFYHIVSLSNKKGIIIMGKIELHILCQITHITDYDRHSKSTLMVSKIKNSCRRFNQAGEDSIFHQKRKLSVSSGQPTNNITTTIFQFFFSLLAKGVVVQPQLKIGQLVTSINVILNCVLHFQKDQNTQLFYYLLY